MPVLATVGWALAAGVRLHTLWYAVYGFRFDASRVLLGRRRRRPDLPRRAAASWRPLGAGMLLIIGGFLVHIRGEWRRRRTADRCGRGLLAVDVVGSGLGGSFWRDYLFPLLPATALCAALLARRVQPPRPRRCAR